MAPSSPAQRISIVIPVHNAGEDFRHCLGNIAASTTPPHEIIVVADGDSDGSWRAAGEFGVTLLRVPESRGPAHARNRGAGVATGDILLFIDSDVAVPGDAVSLVAEVFRDDPELAALFGSYDEEPLAGNFLSQYKNLFHHYVHQTANEEASTFWSGCGAVRREIFEQLSGFNEEYSRPSIEDIELGYRLKKAGCRIRLLKGLKVKHLKRWGVVSLLRADILYRALPWSQLILREGSMLNDLNLKISTRASVVAVCLLILSLLLAVYLPLTLLLAASCILVLFALNLDLYRFFKGKRGLRFAVMTVPWNWLYHFYSGLAFSIAFARHRLSLHD